MKSIHFPVASKPTTAELPVDVGDFLRNAGASACCHLTIEGTLLSSLCAFLGVIGRLQKGESGLGWQMSKAYADMAIRPAFMLTGSAVPFCLSTEPEGGHYFLHVPDGADASTPVLLLLHGYGGNLLYFPWAIWKELPDCILIAPSWQINWSEGTSTIRRRYVEAALAHAEKQIGVCLQKPWLLPLSQGGPTAFMLAAALPEKFSGLLGISTFAENLDQVKKLQPDFPFRMLVGDSDTRVPCEEVERIVTAIQQSGGDASIEILQNSNHFLVLSHREEMGSFLKKYI